uniref:Lipoxygenase n=1 Tax=Aegilops tauschii subsp. strangulata TaxID=200361 RepID=A0A453C2S0_AEGTS
RGAARRPGARGRRALLREPGREAVEEDGEVEGAGGRPGRAGRPHPGAGGEGGPAGGAPAERGGEGRGHRAPEAQGGGQGAGRRADGRLRRQGRPERPARAHQHGDGPEKGRPQEEQEVEAGGVVREAGRQGGAGGVHGGVHRRRGLRRAGRGHRPQPAPARVLHREHPGGGLPVRPGALHLQLVGPAHPRRPRPAGLLHQQALPAVQDAAGAEGAPATGAQGAARQRHRRAQDHPPGLRLRRVQRPGQPGQGRRVRAPRPRRRQAPVPAADADGPAKHRHSRVEYPEPIYVSRDEEFEEGKNEMLSEGAIKALLHNFMPLLVSSVSPDSRDFAGFHDVDNLFKEGLRLKQALHDQLFQKIPFVRKIQENSEGLLRYDTPDIIKKDKFAWLRDDEFARQALAGINPVNIQRLQVFPPVSRLDPAVYGPPESAITEEHIIGNLDGMSVQQALEENKLYMLDYHDIFMPFLDRINSLDGRKAYGTRTLFFLTAGGTLKPIAIELCLPPMTDDCKRAKRVFTPPADATSIWLWQLAKAHVCSNDAGVHQLINHWLRTHACMEPFIIAAHRQMSAMHPIFKLLKPHMRYTLKINALARQILINGDGVIESGFTPGRYCMEMSSFAYDNLWRLDQEGLPADLIRRYLQASLHSNGSAPVDRCKGRRLIHLMFGLSQRYGRGGREPAARAPAAHRGLPLRHRRAAPLVGYRAVVRGLRGGLLPLRRGRAGRLRAAVMVHGGRAGGAPGQVRRAVVAAPHDGRRPRVPAHDAGVAVLGAARGAQLRPVPARRLHPQPAA